MSRTAAAFALIVLAVTAGCHQSDGADEIGGWVRAERRDLVITVEVTGRLQALEAVRLGPPSVPEVDSFRISMMAPEGEQVAAGTPVLAFDTTDLEQQLQTAITEVESVQTRLARQRIDLAIRAADDDLRVAESKAKVRNARLLAGRPAELLPGIDRRKAELELEIAEEELSSLVLEIEAARRAAEAEVEGLASDLQRAANKAAVIDSSLAAMTVTAPRPGIVIHATDWRGEKKKPGDACWRDDRPVEIPDLARMAAECEVREAESGKVAAGQPVRFRLDAHPGIEYEGRIQEVSRIVQRRSFWNPLTILTLRVVFDAPDPERMRPSMRLAGTIEIERIPDAVVVPVDAVAATGSGPMVERRRLFGSSLQPVRLGRRTRSDVQILEGLSPGVAVRRRPNEIGAQS